MFGILNRWRQFGRRYFWPHILLGMVAATFGAPVAVTASEQQFSSFAPGLQHAYATCDLVSLPVGKRRGGFQQVDYWHRHALRNAIRHLTYAIASPVVVYGKVESNERHMQQLVLLNSLLTIQPIRSPLPGYTFPIAKPISFNAQNVTALWLASVQGIRAGPWQYTA